MAIDDANHDGSRPDVLPDWIQTGGAAGTTSCTQNLPADDRKRDRNLTGYVESFGCNHKLNSQICACATTTTTTEVTYFFRAADDESGDVCHNSTGGSIHLDPRLVQDCTLKDFLVRKKISNAAPTFDPQVYTEDENWKSGKVLEEEGWESASCVAYVNTAGGNCDDWCNDHGLSCVMAMDDARVELAQTNWLQPWLEIPAIAVATHCTLNGPADARKRDRNLTGYIESHGCNHALNTQICACATTT